MIPLLLFAAAALSGLYYVWSNWALYRISAKLKGPLALPFLGCAWLIIGKTHEDYLKIINVLFDKYGTMFRFWLGPRLYIMLKDPKRVQSVLYSQECLNRDDVYDFINLLGDGGGLMTLKGDTWKAHRKFLNPCFSLRILQSYMPIFNEQSGIMMKNMSVKINEGSFNFYEFMDACTLDMICQTTLGTEMNIQKGHNQDYLYACNNLFELITKRIFQPLLHSDFLFKFSRHFAETERLRKTTASFVDKVLDQKIIEYKQKQLMSNGSGSGSEEEEEDVEKDLRKPKIYIDQVLDMFNEGKLETKTDVKAHVGTNIATGFETSALITSYCVLMLGMHHDIQQQVYEEIVNYYGKETRQPKVVYEDLNKLELLDRVLKETLRFFPVVPYFARKLRKDFVLDGHTIPKGCRILISMYTLHHDKEVWGPNADKFYPDHFLPENVQQRHLYSYIPFGGGIRNCIGMKYSQMSMKTILIHLLLNYKLDTDLTLASLRPRIDVTLKLVNKHMVSVQRRE